MIIILVYHLIFILANTIICGADGKNRSGRGTMKIGAEEVDIVEAPFVASLQRKQKNIAIHVCGAIIVTKVYLLTAAHCVTDLKKDKGMRTYKLARTEDHIVSMGSAYAERGKVRFVLKFFVHPEFNSRELYSDFGAIAVMRNMIFSSKIQPAKLPEGDVRETSAELNDLFLAKTECKAYGFGSDTPQSYSILSAVPLHLADAIKCKQSLAKSHMGTMNDQFQLCTMEANHSEFDGCHGDTGGPLICGDVVWGVISWGEGCSSSTHPYIYGRADVACRWLQEVVFVAHLQKRTGSCSVNLSSVPNNIVLLLLVPFLLYLSFQAK